MKKIFVLVFVLFCGSVSPLLAQDASPETPQLVLPKPSNFAEQFLHDQGEMWISPLKTRRSDLKWMAPIAVGTAALLATDTKFSDAVRRSENLQSQSRFISHFGSTQAVGGVSASIWVLGKLSRNDRMAESGRLATNAVLQTQLLIGGLKLISGRERPNGASRTSFPSGHAATTFAFASVMAHQYPEKHWVAISSYGLATAVSLSRIGGLNHFPSDVLIGATIGELIGRYLIHRSHHE